MKKRSPAQRAGPKSSRASDETPFAVVADVEGMGAQGHGTTRIGGTKVYIPFTLAGETVRAEVTGTRANAIEILTPSPDRIEPVCKHFGVCGGCALQHWSEPRYEEWKESLVRSALTRVGIEVPLEPLRRYPISSRRKATLTARSRNGKIELGYNAERTHDLVDLEECPILLSGMSAALPHLRAALGVAMPARGEARIAITAAANGLDYSIEGPGLAASARVRSIEALAAAGAIRASWNGEIILLRAVPFVFFGGVKAPLPVGAFLQAVEACERDMADWAARALTDAKALDGPVCDLFCGSGAFTFRVARFAPVSAYEENADAVQSLAAAARDATGIKPVTPVRRDLFRNPLGPLELNKFAGVIADPPREGAEAQARAIAASKIGAAVMISCNPITFARDAAILSAAGFQLTRLAAFDQFKFSAHVEVAALFERPRRKSAGHSLSLRR